MKNKLFLLLIAFGLILSSCGTDGTNDTTDKTQNETTKTPTLSSISFASGITLKETVNADTLAYTQTVGIASQKLTITAVETSVDGTTVKINGDTFTNSKTINLNLGENIITIELTNEDKTKTYTLTITRGFSDYIKPSNTASGTWFGYDNSIAIYENTLVVALYRDNNSTRGVINDNSQPITNPGGATTSGAVYVFKRDNNNNWIQDAYIKASNTSAGSHFGKSVAIYGDTIVVGAHFEDSNAKGVCNTTDGDGAGECNEDSDSNGIPDIQEDSSASNSGAVYVFRKDASGNWYQEAYIKASNTESNDYFGENVDIYEDTIVVGAIHESSNAKEVCNTTDGDGVGECNEDSDSNGIPDIQEDSSASNSGAVYVFTRSGTTWSQEAYIKASNTDSNDEFGNVKIYNNIIVVSAKNEASTAQGINENESSNGALYSGAVYVYTRTGTTWSKEAYIKASNSESEDYFGYSIDIYGNTIVVGATEEESSSTGINEDQLNNGASDSGAVYVYTRSGTTWSQEAYIKASNTGSCDYFGYSVGIYEDTIVVGATGEDSNSTSVNGDEVNNSATDSGAVYVYTRSGTTWSQETYIKASNTEAGDTFGTSTAIYNETIAVGAYGEDSDSTGINQDESNNDAGLSGAVYFY